MAVERLNFTESSVSAWTIDCELAARDRLNRRLGYVGSGTRQRGPGHHHPMGTIVLDNMEPLRPVAPTVNAVLEHAGAVEGPFWDSASRRVLLRSSAESVAYLEQRALPTDLESAYGYRRNLQRRAQARRAVRIATHRSYHVGHGTRVLDHHGVARGWDDLDMNAVRHNAPVDVASLADDHRPLDAHVMQKVEERRDPVLEERDRASMQDDRGGSLQRFAKALRRLLTT